LENGGKGGGGGRGDRRRGKTGLKTISAGNTGRSKIQTQAETGKLQARMNPRRVGDMELSDGGLGVRGGGGFGPEISYTSKKKEEGKVPLPNHAFKTQMIRA
jgi:hypothetical protein